MRITIDGSPEEIAALVLAAQGRHVGAGLTDTSLSVAKPIDCIAFSSPPGDTELVSLLREGLKYQIAPKSES